MDFLNLTSDILKTENIGIIVTFLLLVVAFGFFVLLKLIITQLLKVFMSVSEKLEQLNLNYVENNRGASERDKKYTEMFNANDKKIENLSNTLHSINHKLIEHCASRCKDKRE